MQNSLRYVVRHWGIWLNHYIYMDMENTQHKPSAVKNICGCYHFRDDFSVFGRAVISQPLGIFVSAAACWTGRSLLDCFTSSWVDGGMEVFLTGTFFGKVLTPTWMNQPSWRKALIEGWLLAWSKTWGKKKNVLWYPESMFGHCSHFEGLNLDLRFVKHSIIWDGCMWS